VSTENIELARKQYQTGKQAFERGEYRQAVERFEKAVSLANPNSQLGGEMQIWLVTAYQAADKITEAIELCEKLGTHPDLKTRKQGKRLLYILKAPRLKTRPEWLTQIPDLSGISDSSGGSSSNRYVSAGPRPATRSQPKPEPPVDLSQVNTQDNRFVWVALGAILLTCAGLVWFGT
jgi:tetratricopeptide (TPR) repeat protein